MLSFTAKAQKRVAFDPENAQHYTLFVSGYPFSIGHMKVFRATGMTQVYCLHRDAIAWRPEELKERNFTDRGSALAAVRASYETALGVYHERVAAFMAGIAANLSPVEFLRSDAAHPWADPTTFTVKMQLIFHETFPYYTVEIDATVQEALTIFDRHFDPDFPATPTVEGWRTPDMAAQGKNGYAKWEVPTYAQNYQICDWRSLTGEGRKHTDAFYAGLVRSASEREHAERRALRG